MATSQGYGGNGLLLVLPSLSSLEEEGCLARLRYKLENLYPAQREFAVGQLLSEVRTTSCGGLSMHTVR